MSAEGAPPSSVPEPPQPAAGKPPQERPRNTARTLRERFTYAVERVRHTSLGEALAAVERTGVRLGLKTASIERFESYYQKAHERSIRAGSGYETLKQRVTSLESSLGVIQKSVKNLEDRGLMTSDLKVKLERERSSLLMQVETAKGRRDKAAVALRECNDIKRGWETEQKRAAEAVLRTVEEKTLPYRERCKELQEQYDALSATIDGYTKDQDSIRSDVALLEEAIDASSDRHERRALKSVISGVHNQLKEVERKAAACLRERAALAQDIARAQRQIDKWGLVTGEITRVKERERTYTVPDVEEDSADTESFEDIVITPEDYIKEWNELFPAMPLPVEIFTFANSPEFKPHKIYVAPELEKLLSGAIAAYARTKNISLPPDALKERLDKLRRALEEKVRNTP